MLGYSCLALCESQETPAMANGIRKGLENEPAQYPALSFYTKNSTIKLIGFPKLYQYLDVCNLYFAIKIYGAELVVHQNYLQIFLLSFFIRE